MYCLILNYNSLHLYIDIATDIVLALTRHVNMSMTTSVYLILIPTCLEVFTSKNNFYRISCCKGASSSISLSQFKHSHLYAKHE